MTEFLNPFTGTTCWVADDRVDEYKAAGFTPVANLEKPKDMAGYPCGYTEQPVICTS